MKDSFIVPHKMKFMQFQNWPNAQVATLAQVNDYIPWLCKTPASYLLRDDPKAFAECTLLTHEYLDLDMLFLNTDAYNFEAESMGATMEYYDDHMPDIDRSDYLIKDESDFDKIKWNGLGSGRFPFLLEYLKAYEELCGFPDELFFCAPWSLAGNLYGLEDLIVDAIAEPDFVREFLRRIVEDLHAPMFRDLKKAIPGMKTMNMVDAFASPPMVSWEIIQEFIEPALQHENECLADEGLYVYDAGIWGASEVSEDVRESFVDFTTRFGNHQMIAFDPDLTKLGVKFMREAADRYPAPLVCGLSTNTLRNSTPEEIVSIIKEFVLVGKNGVTPMVMGFNNIAPETPAQNIHAAISAISTYGAPDADENTPFELTEKESFGDFLKSKIDDNKEGYSFEWLERSGYRELL